MLTEDYCNFDTARLLKEKGFEGECSKFYEPNGHSGWKYVGYHIAATSDRTECPTLQMAMKWLREVHKIFISIVFCTYPTEKRVTWIPEITTFDSVFPESAIEYGSYEEATEGAIKYCLENLI